MDNQIEIDINTLSYYHNRGYRNGRSSGRLELLPILTRALSELEEHEEGGCDCAHCEFVTELKDLVGEIQRGR